MKRALFLICSLCWFLFAVALFLLLVRYFVQGAGLQFSVWIFSSLSVLIGLVQVVGLFGAALLCLAVSGACWVRACAAPGK